MAADSMPASSDPTGWRSLLNLSKDHWFGFIVACLAWDLDCMDQQLFVLARKPAVTELLVKEDARRQEFAKELGVPADDPKVTAEISKKIGEETRPAVEKAIDQFKETNNREPNAEEMAVIERSMTTRVMAKVSKDTMTVSDTEKIALAKSFIFETYTTQQEENRKEGSSDDAETACNDVEPEPEEPK